jgi:NADH-quinone oxidoreductase subunit C
MHSEIKDFINSSISEANATLTDSEIAGTPSIYVDKKHIIEVCKLLRDSEKYHFNVLQVMTATDYSEYIEVSYILASFDFDKANHEVIITVKLEDRDNPKLPTLVDLYKAANWQERECYDMMGVTFEGHPDHRRILCPDDWEGFPLRQDYEAAKYYQDMEVYPDAKMNFEDREFADKQKALEKAAKEAAKEKAAQEAASKE